MGGEEEEEEEKHSLPTSNQTPNPVNSLLIRANILKVLESVLGRAWKSFNSHMRRSITNNILMGRETEAQRR